MDYWDEIKKVKRHDLIIWSLKPGGAIIKIT